MTDGDGDMGVAALVALQQGAEAVTALTKLRAQGASDFEMTVAVGARIGDDIRYACADDGIRLEEVLEVANARLAGLPVRLFFVRRLGGVEAL